MKRAIIVTILTAIALLVLAAPAGAYHATYKSTTLSGITLVGTSDIGWTFYTWTGYGTSGTSSSISTTWNLRWNTGWNYNYNSSLITSNTEIAIMDCQTDHLYLTCSSHYFYNNYPSLGWQPTTSDGDDAPSNNPPCSG